MKIALIGATGNIGSKILAEALSRGHEVTAIARHPEKLAKPPKAHPAKGDVAEPDTLASLLKGHDAVVSSVHFSAFKPENMLSAVKKSGVKRYVSVGGAGSLDIAPGKKLVDSPEFPEAYKTEARKGVEYLNILRTEKDLDWTFLSPSAEIAAGKRTGKYRLGKDQLLVAADGSSHISEEDFAVALVDELEKHQHSRQRFTVGY